MYRESITRLTRSPLEENDIAAVQAYLRYETVEPLGHSVPGCEGGAVSITVSIATEFSIPRTTLAFVRNVLITSLIMTERANALTVDPHGIRRFFSSLFSSFFNEAFAYSVLLYFRYLGRIEGGRASLDMIREAERCKNFVPNTRAGTSTAKRGRSCAAEAFIRNFVVHKSGRQSS